MEEACGDFLPGQKPLADSRQKVLLSVLLGENILVRPSPRGTSPLPAMELVLSTLNADPSPVPFPTHMPEDFSFQPITGC